MEIRCNLKQYTTEEKLYKRFSSIIPVERCLMGAKNFVEILSGCELSENNDISFSIQRVGMYHDDLFSVQVINSICHEV